MSYTEHLISMAGGDGDELDQIQARADAATDGPWAVDELGDVEDVPECDLHRFDVMPQTIARTELRKEDGEFIAHARTDIPALLAIVREQRAVIERVRELADNAPKMQNMGGWSPGIVVASDLIAALTTTDPS